MAKHTKRKDCYEPFDESELANRVCWAGMDLAVVNDLCACAYVFPWHSEEDELYRVVARHWIPEATAERMKAVIPYRQWADEGWVRITDGDEVDFESIVVDIAADAQKYLIQDLRYDRAYGSVVAQQLETQHGIKRKEFPQTILHYTFPAKFLERLISKRAIRHNGNKCLTWQIGNVRVKEDVQGNIRPCKPKKNDHRKIDGVTSLLMALSGAIPEETAGGDYYKDHDVEMI